MWLIPSRCGFRSAPNHFCVNQLETKKSMEKLAWKEMASLLLLFHWKAFHYTVIRLRRRLGCVVQPWPSSSSLCDQGERILKERWLLQQNAQCRLKIIFKSLCCSTLDADYQYPNSQNHYVSFTLLAEFQYPNNWLQ